MSTLFEHQKAGVEWLCAHPRGGLFDDQGLGKTPTAIVAADKIGAKRLLVVCPTVVTHNWKRELATWSPERDVQIISSGEQITASTVIVTHGLLLRPGLYARLMAADWDAIIVDESHLFRNPSAQRTRKLFLGPAPLARQAGVCWLLSGTPMPNDPSELWAMLAGLAPERLREGTSKKLLSWGQFREHFCEITESHIRGKGGHQHKLQRVVGLKNKEELLVRLRGFGLRRMKKDVLTLPPVRHGTVCLTTEATLNNPFGSDDVEAIQKSPQFAKWRHDCGLAKVKPTVEMIANDLDCGMQKVVVFAHHLDVIQQLREGLASYGSDSITGAVSAIERDDIVRRFQTDPSMRVLIGQINAAGVGITLTAAADVVLVEPSFVPGDNAQAIDRIVRIGQTKPVLVRWFTMAGSVDEAVSRVLQRKTEMIHAVGL